MKTHTLQRQMPADKKHVQWVRFTVEPRPVDCEDAVRIMFDSSHDPVHGEQVLDLGSWFRDTTGMGFQNSDGWWPASEARVIWNALVREHNFHTSLESR